MRNTTAPEWYENGQWQVALGREDNAIASKWKYAQGGSSVEDFSLSSFKATIRGQFNVQLNLQAGLAILEGAVVFRDDGGSDGDSVYDAMKLSDIIQKVQMGSIFAGVKIDTSTYQTFWGNASVYLGGNDALPSLTELNVHEGKAYPSIIKMACESNGSDATFYFGRLIEGGADFGAWSGTSLGKNNNASVNFRITFPITKA